jgi:hypothetical protein
MHTIARLLLRAILFSGGCVAGAFCVFSAFQNGSTLADGNTARMFGAAFAATTVISWFMLPWADQLQHSGNVKEARVWRAGWVLALAFVLTNSIMFSAFHRTNMVEGNGDAITKYQGALSDKERASSDLAALKKNYRWDTTSGCSNATAEKSLAFCGEVKKVQNRLDAAAAIMLLPRPGAKDAGAETLAWVIDGDPAKVGRAMPIFWAVVLELVASLCMKGAFHDLNIREHAKPIAVAEPIVESTIVGPAEPAEGQLTEAQAKELLFRLLCLIREAGGSYRGQNRAAEALGVSASGLSDALVKRWRPEGYIDVQRDGPAYILVPGKEAPKVKA